ncbi:glyoxalase [Streptomyces chiangmaiensis]
MKLSLEVVTLAVSDVDRALAFYRDQVGFHLDVDYAPGGKFRVVQLTPPGSNVSVQFGAGLTEAEPGGTRGTYLVVTDIEDARALLVARGVPAGEIRHKFQLPDWRGGFEVGTDPERRDYASFFDFADPDGNQWLVQERGHQVARS